LFGFEMGEILDDPVSLAPVLLYLFHRIELQLDGTPTIIVLEEGWKLLDTPMFAPQIKGWLQTSAQAQRDRRLRHAEHRERGRILNRRHPGTAGRNQHLPSELQGESEALLRSFQAVGA
jgi:hypothetical protein